jgi:hypothetical protein
MTTPRPRVRSRSPTDASLAPRPPGAGSDAASRPRRGPAGPGYVVGGLSTAGYPSAVPRRELPMGRQVSSPGVGRETIHQATLHVAPQSSTPSTRRAGKRGSGARRIRRSSVSTLVAIASLASSLMPASPPGSRAMAHCAATSRRVRRARPSSNPGSDSANVRRRHRGFRQSNRRPRVSTRTACRTAGPRGDARGYSGAPNCASRRRGSGRHRAPTARLARTRPGHHARLARRDRPAENTSPSCDVLPRPTSTALATRSAQSAGVPAGGLQRLAHAWHRQLRDDRRTRARKGTDAASAPSTPTARALIGTCCWSCAPGTTDPLPIPH